MPELAGLDVSRETIDRLEDFQAQLLKWNQTINLISKSTVADCWNRHIVDSLQILQYAPEQYSSWTDVGSGGGLPGIVAACYAKEHQPDAGFSLIESDQRKAAFLRQAARTLDLNVKVIAERAEKAAQTNADVFTARALMSLQGLFSLAQQHLKPAGCMIFMKGRSFQQEIDDARKFWQFDIVAHPSLTDNEASVLEIKELRLAQT